MPLKKQKGNMYPWVTHMHSHLGGECPHRCGYCYVQRNRFGVSPRWKGEIRLIEDELNVDYSRKWWDEKAEAWKTEKTIFIEHMNDMFADEISPHWIHQILCHCNKYPDNSYVFQTKNPGRASLHLGLFPDKFMLGTTIETNREYRDSKAPSPEDRYLCMQLFKGHKTFITIEPIMDFDLDILIKWLKDIKPDFVNVGADSKECNLPEPSPEKVKKLIDELQKFTEVRNKSNLNRILR